MDEELKIETTSVVGRPTLASHSPRMTKHPWKGHQSHLWNHWNKSRQRPP